MACKMVSERKGKDGCCQDPGAGGELRRTVTFGYDIT